MGNGERITGQLITRKAGITTPDGRELVVVYGILAMPKDTLADETQYMAFGRPAGPEHMGMAALAITVGLPGRDVAEITRGNTPDGILTEPIWRY